MKTYTPEDIEGMADDPVVADLMKRIAASEAAAAAAAAASKTEAEQAAQGYPAQIFNGQCSRIDTRNK